MLILPFSFCRAPVPFCRAPALAFGFILYTSVTVSRFEEDRLGGGKQVVNLVQKVLLAGGAQENKGLLAVAANFQRPTQSTTKLPNKK